MSRLFQSFAISSLAAMSAFVAAAQEPKQFTARELYYAVAEKPAEKPAAKPQVAKATPKPAAPTSTATPPKPVQVETAHQTTPPPTPAPTPHPAPTGEGRIIAVSQVTTAPAPTAGLPLGLKYTILKLVDGEMVEVGPDTVFHAGDRIRFNVETNGAGYLYIISQGTSGEWKPMFPSSDVDNGSNHVDAFHAYTMPPKSRYYFDEQTGAEKVFIVLSREPEPDLERMIYDLKGGGSAKPASQPVSPTPASTPTPAPPQRQTLMASVTIDNTTVGRLRATYARDLIVETISDTTPGEKKEKAVYVVNPTGSKDSRVVADLTLVHK